MFFSNHLTHRNFFLTGCFFIVLGLPFSKFLISLGVITLTINWLLSGNLKDRVKQSFRRTSFVLFMIFFLLHLISLVYTENIPQGLFNIKVRLVLVILPLIIFSSAKLSSKELKMILFAFISINVLFTFLCLTKSIVAYQTIVTDFVLSFFISPIYFGLLLSLSFGILMHYTVNEWREKPKFINILRVTGLIYILVFNVLMQSRGAIAAIFFLLFTYSVYHTIKKSVVYGMLLGLFLGLFSWIYYNYSPNAAYHIQSIYGEVVHYSDIKNDVNKITAGSMRLMLWESAIYVFSDNLLTGVGIGDVSDVITQENLIRHPVFSQYAPAFNKKFNSHNQYLQTAVALGIIGLFNLLILVIFPFYSAYKKKNLLFLNCIIIILITFLTESVLERQIGVTAFSFFFPLLSRSSDSG